MRHEGKGPRSRRSHQVEVTAGSRLREILGQGPISVNSIHHQAVDRLGEGLVVSARCPDDGIVEGLEMPGATVRGRACSGTPSRSGTGPSRSSPSSTRTPRPVGDLGPRALAAARRCRARDPAPAPPPPTIKWEKNFDEALRKARRAGKPIIVDFWADWCGWCHRLDQTTYADPWVARKAQDFVAAKVDTEGSRKERDVAVKYQVTSLPTIVFLSPTGRQLGRVNGFQGPGQFPRTLEAVHADRAPGHGLGGGAGAQPRRPPRPARPRRRTSTSRSTSTTRASC